MNTDPLVHVACVGLVGVDALARGIRLTRYTREAGGELSFRNSMITTIVGDAAAALTPWRFGGEPARIVVMRETTSVPRAVVALGGESAVSYAVVALCGAWLGSRYGSAWWREIGRGLHFGFPASVVAWIVVLIAVAILVGVGVVLTRTHGRIVARALAAAHDAALSLLRAPPSLLISGLVLSAVSLVARVALLPILMVGDPGDPGVGVTALVSFSLLYGQLVMPTPSGAGAVDALVLGGATGTQAGAGELLAAWRFYATVLPTLAGVTVAVIHFGPGVWRMILKRTDQPREM